MLGLDAKVEGRCGHLGYPALLRVQVPPAPHSRRVLHGPFDRLRGCDFPFPILNEKHMLLRGKSASCICGCVSDFMLVHTTVAIYG